MRTISSAVSSLVESSRSRPDNAPLAFVESNRAGDEQRFWKRYMGVSFIVLAGESAGAFAYFLLSPTGPHRLALAVITAIMTAAATAAIPLMGYVAKRPWRSRVTLGAALASGVVLAVCCVLDGGVDSALILLVAFPVVNGAIVLSFRALALCTVAVVVELVIVVVTDANIGRSPARLVFLTVFIAGMLVLGWGWASLRSLFDRKGMALFVEATVLAETDILTGCLNQPAFFERFLQEVDRALRSGDPLCLMMVDVDLLKAFNDAHGQAAGDMALATVGSALRRSCRSFDVVGRVGGDEFAVVLPATPLADAEGIAMRMSEVLKRPDGTDVTASIGFAAMDPMEPTPRRLYRDVNAGLVLAKSSGRSCAASTGVRPSLGPSNGRQSGDGFRERADIRVLQESVREAMTATVEAVAILDALESSDAIGLGFIDPDFRIRRLNPVMASVNGGAVEDQVGRRVADIIPEVWPAEPAYRAVLETGEPLLNVEVSAGIARDSGRHHSWLANFIPVRAHGDIIGISVIAVDITDRKELEESRAALTNAVVDALAATVGIRDPYTAGHQERVAVIAVAIASAIGLDASEVESVGLAAKIHDVGKLAIPAELLARPGRLREAEMALVRDHAQIGSDMLQAVGFPDHVRELIAQHHERLDGSGYPRGLRGDQILMGARVIAVADVVEAMASSRPYRPSLGTDAAVKELQGQSGAAYDPVVVDTCVRLLRSGQLPVDAA